MKKLMTIAGVVLAVAIAGWAGLVYAQHGHGGAEGKSMMGDMQGMHGMSDQMMARCRMTMGAQLSPRDPAMLLGVKDQLDLTAQQVQQLQALAQQTRQKAAALLTDAQRQEVAKLPEQPQSMMQMHQQMMGRMQGQGHGRMHGAGHMDMCAMMMRMMGGEMEAPATQPANQSDLNAKTQGQVDRLMEAYLAIQQRLAQDQMQDVAAQFAEMHHTAHALAGANAPEDVQKTADAVAKVAHGVEPKDLDEAREVFKPLSSAMIELVQVAQPSNEAASALHVASCPMASADWLQATEQVVNPYMGQRMLRCGNVKQTIKSSSAGEQE